MKLNGIDIRTPTTYTIEPILVSKDGRTASGRATREIIARKRKFTLQWTALTGAEYKTIWSIVNNGTFWAFSFPNPDDVTSDTTTTVYAETGGIKGDLETRFGGGRYVNNELILIEQ